MNDILANYEKIFKRKVIIDVPKEEIDEQQQFELRALKLFQAINVLGNYSESSWFMTLNRPQIVRFYRELFDIWHYRADLPFQTKREICPPDGTPFSALSLYGVYSETDNAELQKRVLSMLENFVYKGMNVEMQQLGALYVLTALTSVSINAAEAMPWLYNAISDT